MPASTLRYKNLFKQRQYSIVFATAMLESVTDLHNYTIDLHNYTIDLHNYTTDLHAFTEDNNIL